MDIAEVERFIAEKGITVNEQGNWSCPILKLQALAAIVGNFRGSDWIRPGVLVVDCPTGNCGQDDALLNFVVGTKEVSIQNMMEPGECEQGH